MLHCLVFFLGPPILINVLEDQYINSKECLTVTIKFYSKLDVHATWFLNEEKIVAGENIVLTNSDIEKFYTLVVKSVPPEYAGKLTAELKNRAGVTSTTCTIHINSMYGVPTNLKCYNSTLN